MPKRMKLRVRRRTQSKSVAVIDIGSNSVRLVVYESMTRALTSVFNEKALCGLGREVQTTGLLAPDAVVKALAALRRFRALCKVMKVGRVYAIATAACRDAKNGAAFIAKAERICGVSIGILSGTREAKLAALGVISGVHNPDGIVGDLGGGSLELIEVQGHRARHGVTLPLGGLALQDASQKSLKTARQIVEKAMSRVPQLKAGMGRTFYAIGGTWRALARIHIIQSGYPLHVMHGYSIPAADALDFVKQLQRRDVTNSLENIENVAAARRPLLAYAALVLEHIIQTAKPKDIVFSTYGVREGLLYEMLSKQEQRKDGLLAGAELLNDIRSRSPRHADDLVDWTGQFVKTMKLPETNDDRRLRRTACLLSDIGWRVHPDYRGEQALQTIMNGNFSAASHQDRAFIALAIYYRYVGVNRDNEAPEWIRTLIPEAKVEHARVLGAAFSVAHLISAAQPGVLPETHFRNRERKLQLVFEHKVADLAADRVENRFKQFARMLGRGGSIIKSS